MGLHISTTDIQLDVIRSPSKLEIQTQNASLAQHQKHARVHITTQLPKVLIDQYECFAEEGLKGNADFVKEAASLGHQRAMEFISKTMQDGEMLSAIENGNNAIAALARQNAFSQKQFGLATIPKSRPKIEVTGNVSIEWERNWEGAHNGVEGTYTPGKVTFGFQPAKVTISVRQYPSVRMEVENRFDAVV